MVKKNNATFNKNNRQKVRELKNRIPPVIGKKKKKSVKAYPGAYPASHHHHHFFLPGTGSVEIFLFFQRRSQRTQELSQRENQRMLRLLLEE